MNEDAPEIGDTQLATVEVDANQGVGPVLCIAAAAAGFIGQRPFGESLAGVDPAGGAAPAWDCS